MKNYVHKENKKIKVRAMKTDEGDWYVDFGEVFQFMSDKDFTEKYKLLKR